MHLSRRLVSTILYPPFTIVKTHLVHLISSSYLVQSLEWLWSPFDRTVSHAVWGFPLMLSVNVYIRLDYYLAATTTASS